MVDKESVEKAIADFKGTKELRAHILNGAQSRFLTELVREARDKVLRPANPFVEHEDDEPCPFLDDDEDGRAGAPNGSSIDAAAVAKMVKDYNDSHPPAPDYTLAKYRMQEPL